MNTTLSQSKNLQHKDRISALSKMEHIHIGIPGPKKKRRKIKKSTKIKKKTFSGSIFPEWSNYHCTLLRQSKISKHKWQWIGHWSISYAVDNDAHDNIILSHIKSQGVFSFSLFTFTPGSWHVWWRGCHPETWTSLRSGPCEPQEL